MLSPDDIDMIKSAAMVGVAAQFSNVGKVHPIPLSEIFEIGFPEYNRRSDSSVQRRHGRCRLRSLSFSSPPVNVPFPFRELYAHVRQPDCIRSAYLPFCF